ncbi:MAG: hypothetical protein ACI37N_08205 [Prevotella sp.]
MPKYIVNEMPDMEGKGKRRVYPKLDAYRRLDNDELVKEVHSYHRAVSESVIEGVLSSVVDVIMRKLSQGYTVKIDDLGVFSLSLAFNDDKPNEMASDDDRMVRRKVEVSNVNFKADQKLIKKLRIETELERKSGGVAKVRKTPFSREERIKNALEVIDRNGFIKLREYAEINKLNPTYASDDLKEICGDPDAPITSRGSGSHKVWVKK